jgi:hypothetical protein
VKQQTAKRAVEAWHWLHNNAHHHVGTDFRPDGTTRAVWFKNHHEMMRVPETLLDEVFAGLTPNKRAFDTRMYALTSAAKRKVTK